MQNNLVCWVEDSLKQWDMIKEKDLNGFLTELLIKDSVDNHTIFIIPANGFLSGIWLWYKSHKSNRVDFFNFFEDFGIPYKSPKIREKADIIAKEIDENNTINSKYGFISPDGRFFHCDFQGHNNLAYSICFGMVDTNNPERYLEDNGWIKIYNSVRGGHYAIYLKEGFKITDEQLETLISMGLDKAYGVSGSL